MKSDRATCRHGYWPGGGSAGWSLRGGDLRAVEKHEAKCKRAHVFWHAGLLGRVICCVGCRSKLR